VSDRTACYLPSGKPVLVQSTRVEASLPIGEGLFTFSTIEGAVAGFEAINTRYLVNCHAERQLAERYFDSDGILSFILENEGF
jgi:hypothetical protein